MHRHTACWRRRLVIRMNKGTYRSKDDRTTIIGDPESDTIKRIYVEKKEPDPFHFIEGFNRVLALQDLKNSDYQEAIKDIFTTKRGSP